MRSRAAGYVQLLGARQVPGNAVEVSSSLGGDDSGGAGAARAGTVDEVRQAYKAADSFCSSANEQRRRLACATDNAAQDAGLLQEVLYVGFILEIVSKCDALVLA